jgi:molecular chaperone HtpG
VPRIVQLLSRSLYPEKEVVVRELVQNASDALVRRASEAPTFHNTGRIVIEIVPSERRLSFNDNGIGMSADDLTLYLGNIGRSGTGGAA